MTDAPMWQVFGACAPESGHDPDLWHTAAKGLAGRAITERAKAICRSCLVIADCREAGLALNSDGGLVNTHGVWGGMDEQQRRRAIRKEPKFRDICGTEKGYQRHHERNERACMACRRARAQATREQRAKARA